MKHQNDLRELHDIKQHKFLKQNKNYPSFLNQIQNYSKPIIFLFCLLLFMTSELPHILPVIRFSILTASCLILLITLISSNEFIANPSFYIKNYLVISIVFWFSWGIAEYFLSPNKMIALGELLRLTSGILSFFTATIISRTNKDRNFLICSILICFCFISIYDMSNFSQKVGFYKYSLISDISLLGTHESIGSLIAILLPFPIAFSVSNVFPERIKMISYAISLILGFALIMVRCRSSWIGGSIGLLITIFLILKYIKNNKILKEKKQVNQTILASPILWTIVGLLFITVLAGLLPTISNRFETLLNPLDDTALSVRLVMWKGGLRMFAEKPLLGWGLGSFLLLQGYWTNLGDCPSYVTLHGTGHQNIAHNYYIQWAAETGLIGLFLFLFSIFLILETAFRSISLMKNLQSRIISISCISSLCVGLIEINGSAAFHFCGAWSIFWTITGILFSQIYNNDQKTNFKISIRSIIINICLSCCICAIGIWYGKKLSNPQGQPHGIFQIVEQTNGPYHPDDMVRWRALYRNGKGVDMGSSPATRWIDPVWLEQSNLRAPRQVKSRELSVVRVPFAPGDIDRAFSDLSMRLPSGETGIIQVEATFRDEFGRVYQASRVINVGSLLPKQ